MSLALPFGKNEVDIYGLPISSHRRDIQMKIVKEILDVLNPNISSEVCRLGKVCRELTPKTHE